MSKKKRVGINLKPEVWELGKNAAFESHKSLSSYIEDFLSGKTKVDFKDGPRSVSTHYGEQLDRIESKLDQLIGEASVTQEYKQLIEDVIIPEKTYRDTDFDPKHPNAVPQGSTDYVDRTTRGDMAVPRSDDEVLKEAQDKLEKIQASRYFNPQPKKGGK